MPNVLISKRGMDYIISAHNDGPLVDLRYCVPVYDDRIDPTLRDQQQLSAFSDIADENLTISYGEKIWNNAGTYTLSDAGLYIISASTFNGTLLSNSYQSKPVQTNLINGDSISPQITATTWNRSDTSIIGIYNWSATGGAGISANNNRPNNNINDFFERTDYYPVYDNLAANELRGSFKFSINQQIGNIKFNKVALYAAQHGINDSITGYEFFGEAYLENPVVRSSLGQGVDELYFDIQIDISGVSATFNELFFSSSADYWSRSPGGLYFPNRIGVGQFYDNVKEISATMHLKKARDTSGSVDYNIPIIRLDNNINNFWEIDVLSSTSDNLLLGGGNLVFRANSTNGFCGSPQDVSIIPIVVGSGRKMNLGSFSNPFKSLYLDGVNDSNYSIHIGGINPIFIGGFTSAINQPGMFLYDVGIDIGTSPIHGTLYGIYEGGDIRRKGTSLINYTFHNSSLYTYPESTATDNYLNSYPQDLWLVAGVDEYQFSTKSVTGSFGTQTGLTHRTLLDDLLNTSNLNEFMGYASINLLARTKIKLNGPVELDSHMGEDNLYSPPEPFALITTNYKKHLIIMNGKKYIYQDYSDLTGILTNRTNFKSVLSAADIILATSSVYSVGDIIPWIDNDIDLGSLTYRYKTIFGALGFFGQTQLPTFPKAIQLGYSPSLGVDMFGNSIDYGIIKYSSVGDTSPMKVQLGQPIDPFDRAYFETADFGNIDNYGNMGVRIGRINNYDTTVGIIKTGGSQFYIGQNNNRIDGIYTNNINTTFHNSTSGYYERNRTTPMGQWNEILIGTEPLNVMIVKYYFGSTDKTSSVTFSSKWCRYAIIGKTTFLFGSLVWTSTQSIDSIRLSFSDLPPANLLIPKIIGANDIYTYPLLASSYILDDGSGIYPEIKLNARLVASEFKIIRPGKVTFTAPYNNVYFNFTYECNG